ncbi:MAG: hypothetical protein LUF84_04190 [Clostridiales bacterium]|nr:hypothetical protein [Clostridiales bacterium]MCD8161371.1 hypothetical protein [Clostridiales bacterium]
MVRVILDKPGAGKTKQLIEQINAETEVTQGNLVCIEPKRELTYDLHYHIRLVSTEDYPVRSLEAFQGFLAGMYASNYDITHIFIDNLIKITGERDSVRIENFLNWLDSFSEKNNIKFTITMNADRFTPTDGIKKFC